MRQRRSFFKSNVLNELPTVHLLSSSTKLNQLLLYVSLKFIFVTRTRTHFCELALSLGRRELIITSTHLHFFLITWARLSKPSEIIYGSVCHYCQYYSENNVFQGRWQKHGIYASEYILNFISSYIEIESVKL